MNELSLSKHYLDLPLTEFKRTDLQPLSKLLAYHSHLYYNDQSPVIADFEYDMLFKKLQELEKMFQINEQQTLKVGSEVVSSSFEKVPHSRPMISLDNTYNDGDLRDFDGRIQRILGGNQVLSYMMEYKFDGLWVELIYRSGKLIQAITRGNGVEGEDITQNILWVKNIPHSIPYIETLEVRGEVVMPKSSFEKLNQELSLKKEKLFSNPRNAASGSLRLKNSEITAQRNLKYFAYDLANMEDFSQENHRESYQAVILQLESFWFEISSFFPLCKGIESVIKHIEQFKKSQSLDFDIDGLVIKLNEIWLWNDLGYTAHHPRYAIAYKFPAEILTTQILSVEHQIGKTGSLTPVANLAPVNIWWVIVKRATLHNYEEIQNLWVKVLDFIFIKRAGEVIPKIIANIKESRTWVEYEIQIPTHCPSCGSEIKKDEERVRYYCPNTYGCPEQIKQRIIASVSKDALNIDGLGKEQVELFLEQWLIEDVGDIFTLPEKKILLLWLEGYKEKSVQNLIDSINKAKIQDSVSFLVSLNIPWIWKQSAKELAKVIQSPQDLLGFSLSRESLEILPEIGNITSQSIIEYFQEPYNQRVLEKLLGSIVFVVPKNTASGIFSGKSFCVTGSFEKYSRDDLVALIEQNSWTFVSSVSKKTDYLLAWEKAGSKLEKANSLGVKVLDLEAFFEMIVQGEPIQWQQQELSL